MKLLRWILPQTLKTKLLIALFSVGFFPYLLILIYSQNLGKEKILESTLTTHHLQIHQMKQQLESQMVTLQKELGFLASLDMMNDMLVADIDKRIAQLLVQKHKDLSLDVHLFAIDRDLQMVSSSDTEKIHSFHYHKKFLQAQHEKKKYFFTYKSIVMFTPIHGSFEKEQDLGYMFMEYAFSNFKSFTVDKYGVRSTIYSRDNAQQVGYQLDEPLLQAIDDQSTYINKQYVIIKEGFEGVLQGWFIVYVIQKTEAFKFLDTFVYLIWALFGFGTVIIALIASWISKRILEPIAKLTKATKSIISTQDYTTQVTIESQGEITELAHDFNSMVQATNHAFSVLEEENRLRLLRFTQLINIFNHLISTQSERECIEVVMDELHRLMPEKRFSFSSEYDASEHEIPPMQCMMLFVKDFEKDTDEFYGKITSETGDASHDPNENTFYQSIATMIMLQLNQIRLIERTQEVSRAKSTFISLMSHELRTPLHTILSAAQYLIGYENTTPQQQDKIAIMESSAEHLLGMINDILDLVQIEAGKVTANIEVQQSTALYLSIKETVEMLEVLAEEKGISLTLENRLDREEDVLLDKRLCKQIVMNLISNAIKFTDSGSIEVRLGKCEKYICVEIKDSGIGISSENLKRLFEDFTQVKNRSQNKHKGSGLGLAISRKLAHLFKAELTLESDGEGKGTRAILQLETNL